jgi:flagellar hook-length control protein FliK
MDIELQLEGNQVVANVVVVNPEVRQLLESALPKLRESLDSAGLNLAGWSFAQSGSRESREFAEQFSAVGGVKTRVAEEVGAVSGTSSDTRDEQSTRAVDVYV